MDTVILGALVGVCIVGSLWAADLVGRRTSRRMTDATIEEAQDLLEDPGVVLERIRQERLGPLL